MNLSTSCFQIGEKCKVGGYKWSNNRIYCWRMNWHLPFWKKDLIIDSNLINSFRKGILGYSFIEIEGDISLPIFIFRFNPPIGYLYGTVNARMLHPEILFEVQKNTRTTITLMLIKNDRIIDIINVLIDKQIMRKFYKAIAKQALTDFSLTDFNKVNGLLVQNNRIKELFMRGLKGPSRNIIMVSDSVF